MITLTYIYGMCTMFFCFVAWLFWRKGGRLNHIVCILTATIGAECVKDYVLIALGLYNEAFYWNATTGVDMVAVPLYAFILTELVQPGRLSTRQVICHELPFVVLPAAYIISLNIYVFYVLVAWAAVYGTYFLLWTMVNIPRYNRHLKDLYSNTDNINLNWLRVTLYTFYVVLSVWIADCFVFHVDIECFYMLSNLVLWMFISYFIYRHESVIDDLGDESVTPVEEEVNERTLAMRIDDIFVRDRVFLNPQLKLSDVVRMVGSNRTYVSNYFNRTLHTTFFDYVNALRVEYACSLLRSSQDSLYVVAMNSGFNSLSTFHRVFCKSKGVTPSEYRRS